MLVLTRKPEEDIVISSNKDTNEDTIVIKILKVQGGKVSIGIQAGKQWQIVRKELLESSSDKILIEESESLVTESELVATGV